MSEAQHTTDVATFPTNPLVGLTAFQRDLLCAVDDVESNGSPREYAELFDYEAPTGQCVKEVVEGYGHDEINHGRLYPNLDDLVEAGLVEKGAVDRRTNGYTLTGKGAEQLAEYRDFVTGE